MSEIVTLPVKNGALVAERHKASLAALKHRDKEAFAHWYQAKCDQIYWSSGQCCAGCDHWRSDMGNLGQCAAAGIVSGAEVLKSILSDEGFYSGPTPEPGLPWSRARFYCGKFRDEFDWSTLDQEYLEHIGATHFGKLKPKPSQPIPEILRDS